MKTSAYVGAVLGVVALIIVAVHADFPAMLRTLSSGGPAVLWLIPYRALFFLLYAIGWAALLKSSKPGHPIGLGYVFWATTVRDAVDRLLPVASVGGSVVGVRILQWRGISLAVGGATVIVEILLTLVAVYLFTALGLVMLAEHGAGGHQYHRVVLVFLLSLPVPAVMLAMLKNGAFLKRVQALIHSWVGEGAMSRATESLDRDVRALLHRPRALVLAGGLQLVALISGAFEIWFALWLFDHPVSIGAAVMLESMTQAIRHVAFVVPAGLGVQEAGLVLFGHIVGISGEMALAVGMVKRIRELAWGLPTLLGWQWIEGRRLRRA
ncbi:MAG: lysylphosphatidylglycerol synthase domain-containing protein [Steroidobacteraceae bacterium]|jgi:putative membrane protein